MKRNIYCTCVLGSLVMAILLCSCRQSYFVMDMVHHNPGEAMTKSEFLDPSYLKANGYGAKVFFLFEAAQFGIDWKNYDESLFPDTSEAGRWVAEKAQIIHTKYDDAKKEGLDVYCMLDMLVLPSKLVEKHRAELTNEKGKIDISKPYTQRCIRELMQEMFDTFPQLDGLVIRTGETYLHDAPYYTGNHPVQTGMHDHVTLINLLREEVCEKRNKRLFYRTWDMGKLHSLPHHYLSVTDSVEPHPNLYFSIKHTMTDFWRSGVSIPQVYYDKMDTYWLEESGRYGVPFNPCIGIGKHPQIVEVQCQREYEGKAAHPNYIAKGVIDGFSEFEKAGIKKPYCLNHVKDNPLMKGIWTWSRGGGWGGPYITNEFWLELNAHVLAGWANNPDCPEEELFADFAGKKGLPKAETQAFRKLCLLSEEGILKGQYSAQGGVYVNWTRDDAVTGDFFLKSYFDQILQEHKVEEYIEEKKEAARIWNEIEQISRTLHFPSQELNHFVRISSTYGRIKYEFLAVAWEIMLRGYGAGKTGAPLDEKLMKENIQKYDCLWEEWNKLHRENPDCPSLYKDTSSFFGGEVGIKSTVDWYRR